jgi:hypothetical protein
MTKDSLRQKYFEHEFEKNVLQPLMYFLIFQNIMIDAAVCWKKYSKTVPILLIQVPGMSPDWSLYSRQAQTGCLNSGRHVLPA